MAERALTEAKEPGPRSRARALAGEACAMLTEGKAALRHAQAGLAEPGLDAETRVRLELVQARALDLLGRPQEALSCLDEAVGQARALGDPRHLAMGLSLRGLTRSREGRQQEGLADVLEAHRLLGRIDDLQHQADVLAAVGLVLAAMEDYERALPYLEQALAKTEGLRSDQQVAVAHYNIALQYQSLKRWAPAAASFQRSLDFSQRAGDLVGVAYARKGEASTSEQLGRREARELMRQALRDFDRLGDEDMRVVTRLDLGRMEREAGELGASLTLLEEGRRIAEASHNQRRLPRLQRELVATLEARGDLARAHAELRRYLELHESDDARRQAQALDQARGHFQAQLKEQENLLLQKESALRESRLERQRALGTLMGAAALLALVAAAGFYRLARRHARLRAEVARLAEVDELTELPNRRSILVRARQELERARRGGLELSVALLDLDHFKEVNDRFGHAAGDAALRHFGALCRRTLRAYDSCGRVGGEEFLVLLPETPLAAAEAAAQRLVEAARVSAAPGGAHPAVTVSAGVTALGPGDATIDQVLARADRALYLAKSEGRDRARALACDSEPLPPPKD